MTTLQSYLTDEKISDAKFAKAIGVSSVSVWRFKTGRNRPSLNTALKIEKETGGRVPTSSWWVEA
jgi:transcriptional regulator with XRE-family HTH domain